MSDFPLPTFDYHEAKLIGGFFLYNLLKVRNEPKPPDEADLEDLAGKLVDTPAHNETHTLIRNAIDGFAEFLRSYKDDLPPDVNKEALIHTLKELNESQRVQLYFAIARYFWTDGNESNPEALCRAGLIDKQRLETAKALERLDQRLLELKKQGIQFPTVNLTRKRP